MGLKGLSPVVSKPDPWPKALPYYIGTRPRKPPRAGKILASNPREGRVKKGFRAFSVYSDSRSNEVQAVCHRIKRSSDEFELRYLRSPARFTTRFPTGRGYEEGNGGNGSGG